jgi:DNA-binding NarL/FixJ family response regulator
MDFFEKVKGLLAEPSLTFDAFKEDTLIEAIEAVLGLEQEFSCNVNNNVLTNQQPTGFPH